jgi:hypothetical protein
LSVFISNLERWKSRSKVLTTERGIIWNEGKEIIGKKNSNHQRPNKQIKIGRYQLYECVDCGVASIEIEKK